MDGFFDKYGRVIIIAVAICFVLLFLAPMRNVIGSSINGFAGNFANKVGESLGTVKMPNGIDNIKREPSSMLIKGSSYNSSSFNGKIPKSTTKIVFTDEVAPKGVELTNLSNDGDVVGWLDGTTWKVSTQDSKRKISFNSDSSYMFYRCYNLKEIQFNNVDTSNVISMKLMFADCNKLENIELSRLDTSNVINMSKMFFGCQNLEKLDLTPLNTSKVENMSNMFADCYNLTTLDLSNFDTSKVTDMHGMFNACHCLKKLDLSSFNTSNVTDMKRMFMSMNDVEMLGLSSFDTSKVKDMSWMFYQSPKLKTVKVRSKSDLDNIKTKATKTPTEVMFEIK